MSPNLYLDLAPRQVQVGVMPFLLGDSAHAVDEIKRRAEIGEGITFQKVVSVDDLPPGHLGFQSLQVLALERRNTSPAGNAASVGQTHCRSPVSDCGTAQRAHVPRNNTS